jgi:hypothetical protein
LKKAISWGHSERNCCNKRSKALIVSAMVVATTAGLVGSDNRSHALVALSKSKLLAKSWQFVQRLCLTPLSSLLAESFVLCARLSIFWSISIACRPFRSQFQSFW